MKAMTAALFAAATLAVGAADAQTAAPAQPKTTVKAIQPGLLEAAGPRVDEVIAGGIQKITATTGKKNRDILVKSPWGDSYFAWPKGVKPMPFEITVAKDRTATISAPQFSDATKADYKAAIDAVVPVALAKTKDNKDAKTHSGR